MPDINKIIIIDLGDTTETEHVNIFEQITEFLDVEGINYNRINAAEGILK